MTCNRSNRTIRVRKGDTIPSDGKVLEGFALVDEAAITGVSAPAKIDSDRGRTHVLAGGIVLEGALLIYLR